MDLLMAKFNSSLRITQHPVDSSLQRAVHLTFWCGSMLALQPSPCGASLEIMWAVNTQRARVGKALRIDQWIEAVQ